MVDDFVQSFQLEKSQIRGRIVRLGAAVDNILSAHNYSDDVSTLTAETLTLTVLLSSMLKYEGIFTFQAQGDGPVRMLVADMTSEGKIRACATFDVDRLQSASWVQNRAELLGQGHMAFTVDQGEFAERYQGIVELKTASLLSSVQHYFTQSEQIQTGIMMAVGQRDGQWRACGIMVQQMPEDAARYNKDQSNINEDDWRRTMILLGSVTEDEMLASDIGGEELLFRLFHEEGVRIFEPSPLRNECRCSVERIRQILKTMPQEDVDDIVIDGQITMTCEFCSRDYKIDPEDLKTGDVP